MSQKQNPFDDYIKNYPRESLQLLLMGMSLAWLTPVGLVAIVLYVLLGKLGKMRWWELLGAGLFIAFMIVAIDVYKSPNHFNIVQYMKNGFHINLMCWKALIQDKQTYALHYFYQYGMGYLLGVPLLFAGILSAVELMQDSPHQKAITALQKGEYLHVRKELSDKKTEF
jgi:hypothetical protein